MFKFTVEEAGISRLNIRFASLASNPIVASVDRDNGILRFAPIAHDCVNIRRLVSEFCAKAPEIARLNSELAARLTA